MNSQSVPTLFINLAKNWMLQASQIAMNYYYQVNDGLTVMTKDDDSPLTKADLEVDAFIFQKLSENFPDIPIVTEERAASQKQTDQNNLFFLVDPIDGTKEFIKKRDEFTINIALIENGMPIAGVVCAPALEKIFYGGLDNGAFELDMKKGTVVEISVSKPDNSQLLVVASRSHLSEETADFIESNAVKDTKNAGSSLKFCVLAKGGADLYPRFGPTMEWDTAAGHAVLNAAGGFVVNLDETPLRYGKSEYKNPWFIAGATGVEYKIPS